MTRLPKPVEDTGRVRYDGAKAPRAAPAAEGDWVQLATPTPAKYGREFIDVGKDAGSFSQLRIDAAKGKVVVRRVKVYFTDGKVAHFDLGRTLDAKRRRAVIDLATNAPIDHVVVETARHSRGEYALYGSSGTVASR